MKHDIQNREDIITLINTFYGKARQDAQIGHFFSEVIQVNWQEHLPRMYNFWEGVIFNVHQYSGNPMQVHQIIHMLHAFTAADFKQWQQLFVSTLDELFEGDNSERAKQRAVSIATIMRIKMTADGA